MRAWYQKWRGLASLSLAAIYERGTNHLVCAGCLGNENQQAGALVDRHVMPTSFKTQEHTQAHRGCESRNNTSLSASTSMANSARVPAGCPFVLTAYLQEVDGCRGRGNVHKVYEDLRGSLTRAVGVFLADQAQVLRVTIKPKLWFSLC
eukprot:1144830-Pelagomonas_calceolata.AAC.4